ncbi:hypothetical protein [Campylobacter ureolyticus]|uniref:Uncharacterized protein n=1 Tax=Campylobacter ureolyticus TaxID=827 RepID=A0A9Q4PVS2_9BACT|nr:hypothetical protein [Campylobacter ureolyticus]MCZ6162204.1 hypothetical protein [Campylobacter ureolyticus]
MKKVFIFFILALNLAFSNGAEEFYYSDEILKTIAKLPINLEKCKNGDDEICDLIASVTENKEVDSIDPQKFAEFVVNKDTIRLCENKDKDVCLLLSIGAAFDKNKNLDEIKEFALKSENNHLIGFLENINFENIINSCQNENKNCEQLSIMQKYGIFVKKDEEKAEILKEKVCKDEAGFFCSKYDTGILNIFSAFCDKGSIKACILLLPAFEETYQIPYAILAQNRLLNLYENSDINLGENLFEKALNDKKFVKCLNENLDIFLALFGTNEEYNLIKDSDLPKYYGLLAKNGFDFNKEIDTINVMEFTIYYTKDEILVEILKNILPKIDLNSPILLRQAKDFDKKQSFKFLMENGANVGDILLFSVIYKLASPFDRDGEVHFLKAGKLGDQDKEILKSEKYQEILKREIYYLKLILEKRELNSFNERFVNVITNFANLINDENLNEILFNTKLKKD